MNILFSDRMNFASGATDVPPDIVEETHKASRKINDPETAKALFEELIPILESCRPNRTFAIACGMLMEKQRNAEGMLAFWADLLDLFPNDLTALRMQMRWYRRERRSPEGVEKVHLLFPECHQCEEQAEKAIVALSELRAFKEIDEMMNSLFQDGSVSRALRMRYLKVLSHQLRYLDAINIVETIEDQHKMGPSSQELISRVKRRSAKMQKLYSNKIKDPFSALIAEIEPQQSSPISALGNITFFTGQLGTGGAETQLTRIVSSLQQKFENAESIAGVALTAAPTVCVRHAAPESGGDFFLPVLKRARVRTTILTELNPVSIAEIKNISAEQANLLDVMPEDIAAQTCKLIPYFQRRKTNVAYLWQDGGVLSASIAALLAGIPRIITSFRGLPPNLRPNLMRPEFEPLYRALASRDEVTFTANSQKSASAYEDWLDLNPGTVKTIPNAMLEIQSEGDETDTTFWKDVILASASCTQTVLGIFRFDDNKRPLLWIDVAAEFARNHPTVRFVLLGSGYLFAKAKARVLELGLSDRIFLAGLRRNVGFYLHRCDLVMHLARMEGLPNVVIEAHLAGKPVLATPAGGTDEVVQQNVTGRLLSTATDPKSSEILTELSELLRDPQRMRSMGEDAAKSAQKKYLTDHVLAKTIRLFANREVAI